MITQEEIRNVEKLPVCEPGHSFRAYECVELCILYPLWEKGQLCFHLTIRRKRVKKSLMMREGIHSDWYSSFCERCPRRSCFDPDCCFAQQTHQIDLNTAWRPLGSSHGCHTSGSYKVTRIFMAWCLIKHRDNYQNILLHVSGGLLLAP